MGTSVPRSIEGNNMAKNKNKIEKVMHEYHEGKLHSGSKKGPQVKNKKQAIAIALSEARKAGESVAPKKGKKKKKHTTEHHVMVR